MTVVVLGIDALDPVLVDEQKHPYLVLDEHKSIEPVISTATDEPSTHESWPSIITGLSPEQHGLELEKGIEWENPILSLGSRLANNVLPDRVRSKLGSWLLNNTDEGAFRVPATYYENKGLETLFSGVESKPIGIPNYVLDPDNEDREHQLRKSLGDLFQHDPDMSGEHKHRSSDPRDFYELCLEMSMIRIARVRRGLRGNRHELVFGYTSGLDLVGHISYQLPGLQKKAYQELNEFVGELYDDLDEGDELFVVSDHGLQDGIHTNEAFFSGTKPSVVRNIDHVLDVKRGIEHELETNDHKPGTEDEKFEQDAEKEDEVREHLEDLGYM